MKFLLNYSDLTYS